MNKYVVEFLGTMFLMIAYNNTGEALPIGLTLTLAIMLGGSISGGHFNPAVSIAKAISKKITLKDLLIYVAVQIAGAFTALHLNKVF